MVKNKLMGMISQEADDCLPPLFSDEVTLVAPELQLAIKRLEGKRRACRKEPAEAGAGCLSPGEWVEDLEELRLMQRLIELLS